MRIEEASPTRGRGELAAAIARAGLGALPFVGAPAAELFNWIVGPRLDMRRDAWLTLLAEEINRLAALLDEFSPERLAENDAFLDAVLATSAAALKTSSPTKLLALRHAVVNSARPNGPDEIRRSMFLTLVDELSETHLLLLEFLNDAPGWYASRGLQPAHPNTELSWQSALMAAFPGVDSGLLHAHIEQLAQRGLCQPIAGFGVPLGPVVYKSSRLLGLGEEFLAFIRAADDPEPAS